MSVTYLLWIVAVAGISPPDVVVSWTSPGMRLDWTIAIEQELLKFQPDLARCAGMRRAGPKLHSLLLYFILIQSDVRDTPNRTGEKDQ